MNFAEAMNREGSIKRTENGAMAYDTTGQGALLDFFSQAGALRPRSVEEIQKKFAAAYREDHLLATKALFYTGDIRQGGLGERRTFRACLKWMAQEHPSIVKKNLEQIPYFNRFDSWFELVGTPCEGTMWDQVAKVLTNDLHLAKFNPNVPITLLAKWMPSENASSLETKRLARKAMGVMGLTPREYRRMLSKLRKHINVVESFMSAGNWDKIDYAKVPSYAMHNYGSAFAKHDYQRFDAYLQSVKSGEVKIHASVLFPYDLVHEYLKQGYYHFNFQRNEVAEAQWKALPNYLTKDVNAVVMADISGSMYGRPMETSIGLATYFAQHNTGMYHNKYMTFSEHPSFIKLTEGASLAESITKVVNTGMGYSTNLEGAFQEILDTAVQYRVPANEMPKALVVISDMEIDGYFTHGSYCRNGKVRNLDFVQTFKNRFAAAGYTMPKLVMWNVEARNDTYLTQNADVVFLSGQSAATFKNLCQNLDGVTAYEMMVRVLNNKAYDCVTI